MKRYLYEIDVFDGGDWWHWQEAPFMPKVLAEKTAKALNRSACRKYKTTWRKFKVSKTNLVCDALDSSPRGAHDYFSWNFRKENGDWYKSNLKRKAKLGII